MNQSKLAKPQTKSATLHEMISSSRFKAALSRVCDRALDPEKMINMIYQAATRNPKLMQCTPRSIAVCLLKAAQAGLEIESPLQHAHAVPYGNEAVFIPGFRGIAHLIRRGDPQVSNIETRIVYKNDKFILRYGEPQEIRHEPELDGDPGEIRGAYMMVKYKDGRPAHIEYMSLRQLESVAAKAASKEGPWNPRDPENRKEMMRKTVLKRGAKVLPLSSIAAQVIEYDNKIESEGVEAAEFELVNDPFTAAKEAKPETGMGKVAAVLDLDSVDEAEVEGEVSVGATIEIGPPNQKISPEALECRNEIQGFLDRIFGNVKGSAGKKSKWLNSITGKRFLTEVTDFDTLIKLHKLALNELESIKSQDSKI